MSKQKKEKKPVKPLSNRTLNLLLAAAIIVMLIPFGIDAFLALREKNSTDILHTDPFAVTVMDDAGVLTDSEAERLEKVMLPVTAYYPVAFVTTNSTGGTSAKSYSQKVYNRIFGREGGILFLIDFDTTDSDGRQIYLRVTDASTKLSVSKCNTITDNVYTYARDGRYYECARQVFLQCHDVLNDKAVPQPMKHMSNLLIAICLALYFVFKTANNRTRIKTPAEVYLLDNNITKSVVLTNPHAKLIRRYTVSNAPSGGGGGGGGGGFSGGGGGGGGGGSHGGGHGF